MSSIFCTEQHLTLFYYEKSFVDYFMHVLDVFIGYLRALICTYLMIMSVLLGMGQCLRCLDIEAISVKYHDNTLQLPS